MSVIDDMLRESIDDHDREMFTLADTDTYRNAYQTARDIARGFYGSEIGRPERVIQYSNDRLDDIRRQYRREIAERMAHRDAWVDMRKERAKGGRSDD